MASCMNNNKSVAVAMLGARMHYAVPRLFYEAGLLDRFFTDSYIGNKPWLEAALRSIPDSIQPSIVARWLGRKDEILPPEKVISFEPLGLWYGYARQRAVGPLQLLEVSREVARRFNQNIFKVGLGQAQIVWSFNGPAHGLFQAARQEGRICVLEQTILPRTLEWRLMAEEQQRWPTWEEAPTDWSQTPPTDDREEGAWELADAIVVGSDFVRDGLVSLGVAPEKIHVIPYGVDPERFSLESFGYVCSLSKRPLRVLFAGTVGLRKGVPDLLDALQSFNPGEIEARLAGSVALRDEKLELYQPWAKFLRHVPRSQMRGLFQWADVFVLPSIVEGSATVTYEAIMSGCPVITTPNSGSIIQDGVDGFIVPVRDPEQIAAALRRYIEEPGLLDMHRQALSSTRERASFKRYKADLVRLIEGLAMSR